MEISKVPIKEQVLDTDSIPVGAENSKLPFRFTMGQIRKYVMMYAPSKDDLKEIDDKFAEAKDAAVKSAWEAERSKVSAALAQELVEKINEAMQQLPDGQSVSQQVAINTALLSVLSNEDIEISREEYDKLVESGKDDPTKNYYIYEEE